MKRTLLLFVTIIFWVNGFTQAPSIQWQNTIGGSSTDWLYCIQQTNDGGYICGGFSISNISGDKTENNNGTWDYWLIKTDVSGNIQWQNSIGGSNDERLYSIQQTADDGYILGGSSRSNISGDKTENCIGWFDYWVVKTDASGNIQWQNTIGGSNDDNLSSVQQTSDGGYILGGYSLSNISGDKTENSNGGGDYWIVKIDATGNIQWQNTIGGNYPDYFSSIWQTTDGGYILGGYSLSNISGDKTENNAGGYHNGDYWLVKTDASGNIQWQNTIGGDSTDILSSVQQTLDGGYILGGYSYSNISGDKTKNNWDAMLFTPDYWLVKTDASGNIQWQNTIGGSNEDYLNCIQQTIDGGYILGGHSYSDISGDKTENNIGPGAGDYWLIKTDSSGNIQWQNTIGGSGVDKLYSVQQTTDGGYILGGSSRSSISGDKTENCIGGWWEDYWIVKLSPEVGFEELAAHNTFHFSPNPATDELIVRGSEFGNKNEIEIYNVLGEKVYSQQVSNQQPVTVDVSRLLPGVYLVAVTDDKGNKITRRFVKM